MKKSKKKANKESRKHFIESLTISKSNYLLFALGILVIIIGYFIMASGGTNSYKSLTLAPIILLIGYLVIVPAAILYKQKKSQSKSDR